MFVSVLTSLTLGVASNLVHGAIRASWSKLTSRTWEELFYDSFNQAFKDLRPQFNKHTKDGKVTFSEERLRKLIRQDLMLHVDNLSYSDANPEELIRVLANGMSKADILAIGGHTLSSEDYKQLVRSLIKQASNNFKTAILTNERAFRETVLTEVQGNRELTREIFELLKNLDGRFDRLTELVEDTPKRTVEEMREQFPTLGDVSRFPVYAGIPSNLNPVIGQEDFVQRIAERLTSGQDSALALEGLGGIGKTTLAIALAKHTDIQSYFGDGILWASLGLSPDVDRTLISWLEALRQNIPETADTAQLAQRVKSALGNRRLLFIIDDVWDIQTARLLCCGGPNCRYMITTRDRAIARDFAGVSQVEQVPFLSDEVAYRWLNELAPEACATDPETARALAKSAGGLPLVIKLLGGYLSKPEHSTFTDLQIEALEDMRDSQNLLQRTHRRLENLGRDETLRATILLSLEALPESAVKAFHALGAFAPKPESFTREAAEVVAETDGRTLAKLVSRNLIEKMDGEWLTLHQVVASAAEKDEQARLRHLSYYINILEGNQGDWQKIKTLYGQTQLAWITVIELADVKVVKRLFNALFTYQMHRGLWQEALSWVDKALNISRVSENIGVLYANRGLIYYRLGLYNQALNNFDISIPLLKSEGAEEVLAETLGTRGLTYNKVDKNEEALFDYKQALVIAKNTGDAVLVGKTLQKIGDLYANLRQCDLALKYLYPAAFILQAANAQESLGTTLRNIGYCFRYWNEPEKSIDCYDLALSISKKIGDLSSKIIVLDGLGNAYDGLSCRTQSLLKIGMTSPTRHRLGIAQEYFKEAVLINKILEKQIPSTQSLLDIEMTLSELDNLDNTLRYSPIVMTHHRR